MALVPATAERVSVGKSPKHHPVPQEDINRLLVARARTGQIVVRLKGGDPFVFGRGSEEMLELIAAGIPVEVVPGITAAQGCAAALGVPLTHRDLASGVRFVTGHCRRDLPLDLDWAGLADPETTLVVYMGASNIRQISGELIAAGLGAETPVLIVNRGTTPQERRLVSSLGQVPGAVERAAFTGPVLFLIGRVVSLYRHMPMATLARELRLEPAHA